MAEGTWILSLKTPGLLIRVSRKSPSYSHAPVSACLWTSSGHPPSPESSPACLAGCGLRQPISGWEQNAVLLPRVHPRVTFHEFLGWSLDSVYLLIAFAFARNAFPPPFRWQTPTYPSKPSPESTSSTESFSKTLLPNHWPLLSSSTALASNMIRNPLPFCCVCPPGPRQRPFISELLASSLD